MKQYYVLRLNGKYFGHKELGLFKFYYSLKEAEKAKKQIGIKKIEILKLDFKPL